MSTAYEQALQRALDKWGSPGSMPARYVASFADGFYEGWSEAMKAAHGAAVGLLDSPVVDADKMREFGKRSGRVEAAALTRAHVPPTIEHDTDGGGNNEVGRHLDGRTHDEFPRS